MKPIIIDTDPGVDDAMAIAFGIAHPELELLGLTTVFGNVPVARATQNALSLLEQFGAPDIPVAQGAAAPLEQEPLPHPTFVHGEDGMGNIGLPAPTIAAQSLSAAEFIVEQANARPGEITVIPIGPLTNIALALELDPELPSKLAGLVVMGGAVDEPGNVSPVAEANFLGDPHAADVVLGQNWPATVVGLDVTHKILLTDTHLAELRDHAGKAGNLIWGSSRFYVDYYSSTGAASEGKERACAMHDATAVVCALDSSLFSIIKGATRVAVDGVAAGQMLMNRRGYTYLLDHWKNRPDVYACMDLDVERVRRLFLDTIRSFG